MGYNMSLWTTKLLRHFLYTRCGIEYGRERVRQLLHSLGFRQRRLRHCHLKANPQEQDAFVTDLHLLLQDWPEDWELLFVDEVTIRRHPTLSAMWCLANEIPEVPTADDHTKVQVYGAVAPLAGRTHYRMRPTLSKGEFAMFLRQLQRTYQGKHILIIHDRAEQHRGPVVDTVVQEAQGHLMLMPQPRYSPELNPQKRLWKWLRRVVTHTHWFATLQEELQAIRDFFCYLAGRKDDVRQLCAIKTPESLVASL
jgi:transposase